MADEEKIAQISAHSRKINPHGRYTDELYLKILDALIEGRDHNEICDSLKVTPAKVKDALIWSDLIINNKEARTLAEVLAGQIARRKKVEAAKDANWSILSQVGDVMLLCLDCKKETQHRSDVCLVCVKNA